MSAVLLTDYKRKAMSIIDTGSEKHEIVSEKAKKRPRRKKKPPQTDGSEEKDVRRPAPKAKSATRRPQRKSRSDTSTTTSSSDNSSRRAPSDSTTLTSFSDGKSRSTVSSAVTEEGCREIGALEVDSKYIGDFDINANLKYDYAVNVNKDVGIRHQKSANAKKAKTCSSKSKELLPLPKYLELLSASSGGQEGRSRGRSGGGGRSGPSGNRVRSSRYPSDFTYVSSWIKYSMFFFNFLFWLLGFLLCAIGLYAIFDKWSSGEGFKLDNVFDVIFNLAFFLVLVGGIIFFVSFAGCIGALRENMCMLKLYSVFLLLFFLAEMALAALGFIFPHKVSHFMEESLSDELIKSYRDDLDFQNLIDLVQKEFHCCGISSDGFRDWSKNEYFNCTKNPADNPSVERCGVPYSCCLPGGATSFSDDLVNIMCGFSVQEMKKVDLIDKIYTRGCIQSIQGVVEQNMTWVGSVALGVALAQLLALWLSRTLEGQIENQRSLWRN